MGCTISVNTKRQPIPAPVRETSRLDGSPRFTDGVPCTAACATLRTTRSFGLCSVLSEKSSVPADFMTLHVMQQYTMYMSTLVGVSLTCGKSGKRLKVPKTTRRTKSDASLPDDASDALEVWSGTAARKARGIIAVRIALKE